MAVKVQHQLVHHSSVQVRFQFFPLLQVLSAQLSLPLKQLRRVTHQLLALQVESPLAVSLQFAAMHLLQVTLPLVLRQAGNLPLPQAKAIQ